MNAIYRDPMNDLDSDARLYTLLDEALDIAPSERIRWVEALPEEVAALKPRLRSLLETPDTSALSFDTLPKLPPPAVATEHCNEIVGPYRLERVLGVGGMATVWLARRVDGLFDRQVALKIPHGAWKCDGLEQRLACERSILAALNHSNIAKLFDAGLTTAGKPYLALEYVEGEPIDAYCRERDLSVRQRLKLFLQVANAVAYAHGKLIVHRDLKPANILVAANSQVHLLDFGIARLLDGARADPSPLTELTGRALTPDYASPEQIAGAPITIASDVYSLGVILFELLANCRPYKLKRDSRGALEDAILDTEPRPPSELSESRVAKRVLRGDLDTIVLRALRKQPEARYATVNAFADDVQRYLDGMPVIARPTSALYRARRFVSRHLFAVGAFATFIVGICTALGVAVSQRNLAVTEREHAEQVRDVVISVFREADLYKRTNGTPIGPADLLGAASNRVEHTLRAQPLVALELLTNIGESQYGLGQHVEAAATLEAALRTGSPLATTEPVRVARVHRLLAQVYALVGRVAESDTHLDTALRMLADRHNNPEFIELQLQRSANAAERAAFDEAFEAAQSALHLASTTPGASVQALAQAWRYSAVVYRAKGDSTRAIESYGRAYALAREAYQYDVRHPFVMETRMGYARALMMENRWTEAYEHMRAAVDASANTFGPEASLTINFLQSLGHLETKLGDIEAGLEDCRKSLAIYERIKRHGTRAHATQLRSLGFALLEARRDHEAATFLARSESMRAGLADPYELPATRTAYALALIRLQQLDAAESLLDKVAEVGSKLPASIAIELHLNRGMLQRHRGDYRGALRSLTEAFVLALDSHNTQYTQALVLNELGQTHSALDQHDIALIEYRRAAELIGEVQRRPTPALADAWLGMGRALLAQGHPQAAAREMERASMFWKGFGAETDASYREAKALHALALRGARSQPLLVRME